jgi:hypothetical protein
MSLRIRSHIAFLLAGRSRAAAMALAGELRLNLISASGPLQKFGSEFSMMGGDPLETFAVSFGPSQERTFRPHPKICADSANHQRRAKTIPTKQGAAVPRVSVA